MEVNLTGVAKTLAPGKMTRIDSNGESILVANVKGKFYAIRNICTHNGCSLSDGVLTGVQVQCPCHGSTFDVTTGSLVKGPAKKPEPSYKVTVRGDEILSDI
jgi:nitrite reductase/ring-hydroxylating ferredoxin subunit